MNRRKYSYFAGLDNVSGNVSLTSFKTLVSKVFETESGSVVTGSLSGISDPVDNVVETKEFTNFRLLRS